MSTEHQAALLDNGDFVGAIPPQVLETARLVRGDELAIRAANPPRLPETGHTLWAEIRAHAIDHDGAIQVAIVITGQAQRPEVLATATGEVLHLRVPARVEARSGPRTAAESLEAVQDLGSPERALGAPNRAHSPRQQMAQHLDAFLRGEIPGDTPLPRPEGGR